MVSEECSCQQQAIRQLCELHCYSTIHKAAILMVPHRSMICLVRFHRSTVPTMKLSLGEQPLGGGSNQQLFREWPVTKELAAL